MNTSLGGAWTDLKGHLHGFFGGRLYCLESGDHVTPETQGIVVGIVQAEPGDCKIFM